MKEAKRKADYMLVHVNISLGAIRSMLRYLKDKREDKKEMKGHI